MFYVPPGNRCCIVSYLFFSPPLSLARNPPFPLRERRNAIRDHTRLLRKRRLRADESWGIIQIGSREKIARFVASRVPHAPLMYSFLMLGGDLFRAYTAATVLGKPAPFDIDTGFGSCGLNIVALVFEKVQCFPSFSRFLYFPLSITIRAAHETTLRHASPFCCEHRSAFVADPFVLFAALSLSSCCSFYPPATSPGALFSSPQSWALIGSGSANMRARIPSVSADIVIT